ncbi:MAG: alcohol dehydrogenase catalytic domain-containing protein [Planctomycetota bacterium]
MQTYETKAFVYHGRPGAVSSDIISFAAGPEDMVVEVILCARCGTDKTIYKMGHKSVDQYAPVVLGHELVGKIVHVGEKVCSLQSGIGYREGAKLSKSYLAFKIGERVTFQSRIARYRNGLMLIPNPIANLSFQINGGYSQYMKVPPALIRSASVLRVPDNVSDEEACLVEPSACALESIYATPHQVGVDRRGRHLFHSGIKPGGNVCIIGSGTVGMIYAKLAFLEGAGRVVMIVRSDAKLRLAQRLLGPRLEVYQMPPMPEDDSRGIHEAEEIVVRDLQAMTDGYLFDDVIAACAASSAQRLMLKLYTPEGYAVGACFGGTHQLVDGADIDSNHYRAAKTIGTSGCSTDGMKTILEMLEKDKLDLNGFTSPERFTLDDNPHDFFSTDADGLKPVLYPSVRRLRKKATVQSIFSHRGHREF